MASFSSTELSIFVLLLFSSMFVYVSCFQFQVGGDEGWVKPSGDEVETYNEWAVQHRFHIGDALYFKYKNDSVLQVDRADYETCNTSNAIAKFDNGKSVIELDRSGFFCFISGKPGHCEAGQKMIIRVMVQSGVLSPMPSSPAPSPVDGSSGGGAGDDWWGSGYMGPTSVNSGAMVNSYSMAGLTGFLLVLCLFMN